MDLCRAPGQVVLFGEGLDGVDAFSDAGLEERGHLVTEASGRDHGHQLWAFPPQPEESGRFVHDDTFTYLKRAGFDTTEIEREDRRRSSWWSEIMGALFGVKTPDRKRLNHRALPHQTHSELARCPVRITFSPGMPITLTFSAPGFTADRGVNYTKEYLPLRR